MTEVDPHLEAIESRLGRIETRMDSVATREDLRGLAAKEDLRYYATREDVANLRADIANLGSEIRADINRLTLFFVSWTTGLGVSLVAASFLIARYL